jgi:autotransporter-associated beta strand protein
MKSALNALPTLSLVIGRDEMFGPSGVYSNPMVDGLESAVSAEWIGVPGSPDVQIDAALRVQGGASREFPNTPKKSLRLLFKSEFGEGRLNTPVLADGGTALADFNTLILRSDYNNSWLHWDSGQRLRGSIVRDQWVRDTQIAMSGIGSHGNQVHLYVNGIYWGVYNPAERPDAAFAATYLGGEREDYDAMTHSGIRDGDNIAWNAMRSLAQGGLSTPAQYEAIQQYLNIDHFIDYMILNIYGGNQDWPHNNWNATRLRQQGAGYLFHCWDAERSLENVTSNRVSLTGSNNPAEFYAALRANAEFRLRFADRLHRHCFNGGALTPEANIARYSTRAAKVEAGIFGEQARWGAYRNEIYDRNGPSPRYALDPHWLAERDRLINDYFPSRTSIVIGQFKNGNLYPNVDAPTFSQHGGNLEDGQEISISAPAGTIYYTLDGSDPRVPVSSAVSATAMTYGDPVVPATNTVIKARVLSGSTWSALTEAGFFFEEPEITFLPTGSGDWTLGTSWSSLLYPDGPGKRALIPAPASADRNIELRAPVTIGGIRFAEGGSPFRDRVRDRETGNTLTFDGGQGTARIVVEGHGTGYAEIDVVAGTILTGNLELAISHSAGHPNEGALRLRSGWSGPGGLTKTGPGVAALTGAGKSFTGPLELLEGVVSLTEPATPSQASAVSVQPGAQLRLVSGSSGGPPRTYAFAAPLKIAGFGRGESVPDGAGQGKLGAIRYAPGSGGPHHAVLASAVELTGPASIHVDGSQSRLDVSQPLAGAYPLTKSGGGTLFLGPEQSGYTRPVTVLNGRLEISGRLGSPVELSATATLTGAGSSGVITGQGTVLLDQTVISAPAAAGIQLAAVIGQAGPDLSNNGLLALDTAPGSLSVCRIYLPNPGELFRGVFFTPPSSGLQAVMRNTSSEVYAPAAAGGHSFAGQSWSLVNDAQLVTVPVSADFGDGTVWGHTVEIRIGAPPASFDAWKLLAFPNPDDLGNPAVSGPLADPSGSGVPNLLRHALGLGLTEPPADSLPMLETDGLLASFSFPFDPGRDDIACVVETTGDLTDWSEADILFDSRIDHQTVIHDGWLTVTEPLQQFPRFFRLRVEQIP